MPPPTTPQPFTLDIETGLSLALAFSFMPAAQFLANTVLPKKIVSKYYWIFVWGAYDFLTHTILEGSYLYHCFMSYETISVTSDYPHPASLGGKGPYFLSHANRNYGSWYSMSPMARIWQEYAKADTRWGGSDLVIISIEILTVGLAGPAAAYICYLIAKFSNTTDVRYRAKLEARMWFLAIVLSTGELYGGFMTFAPEWMSGMTQLATEDPVYLWLYLFFFNTVWVWIPGWILYEAYSHISGVFTQSASITGVKKTS